MDMNEKVRTELDFIENNYDVRIVFACESGSRSWGFESPDSDYDVRFVYVRPIKDYLRLDKVRDVIEWPRIDDLDVNGWDLTKFLTLMRASNPTVFEWLGSPIVYHEDSHWNLVRRASHDCFSPLKSAHHYLGMATHNYNEHMKRDSVRPKKVLYVIRAILACRHVTKSFSVPPVSFSKLADEWLEHEMTPFVNNLLDLKRSEAEDFTISHDSHALLFDKCKRWAAESLETLNQDVLSLRRTEKCRWDDLNDVFWSFLGL